MLELFKPVQDLLQSEPVRVDNIVFRLHSRVTVILLSICAILVTAKQYFGEPITCIPDASIDKEPVNAYCWIYSTFTVSRHLRGVPGKNVASPGVGQAFEDDEIHHHRYYQWPLPSPPPPLAMSPPPFVSLFLCISYVQQVCFVLILQAILFYTPRALWGVWEAGIVGHLARDLSAPFPPREAWTHERKRQLVEYFALTSVHNHNFYAFRFFICELLNFVNVTGQIYLLDVFLDGQFSSYGASVSAFAMEAKPFDRIDPMARLFPKVTKCTIHTFGSGGSTQTLDALCILPLNVVNEKIFVFLWFWLVLLAGISGLAIFYRIIVFTQPWARVYLLRGVVRVLPQTIAARLVEKLPFGDWFLLYQLAHNVNPIVYRELVNEIANSLSDKCIL
ncbi:innexin inx2-like [Venturia canescens]|uniref:innexin inx2-like n=1 Tax=Venturia canescens TaxID=32260 RepID=UPI001C9BF282|nr:innexin inx2-like [Venturia canescens]